MCHVSMRGSRAGEARFSEETGLKLRVAAIRVVGSAEKPTTVEAKHESG